MMLISDAVWDTAHAQPDVPALVDETGAALSYRDLARTATGLTTMLRELTNQGGRVAVVTRKDPATVVAMLAVLNAGRCYVPIDPGAPRERRDFILQQAACELLLADSDTDHTEGVTLPVLDLPTVLHRARSSDASTGEPVRVYPGDEAYVLYTSGSTGTPKGVVITHRNASAFVRWAAAAYPLRPGDQVAVHAPLHFDLPVYDIYVGLAGGATLHPVPERTALFPQALYRFLHDRAITHLYAVPSALTALLHRSALPTEGLPTLRQLLYAGEEFRAEPLAALMNAVPQARISNLYGPIETNVVTHLSLTGPVPESTRVPLGRPIDGVTLALLDDHGRACEYGPAEGEIVIAGDCVTPGYLARPDLTDRAKVELTTETGRRRFYRTGDFARRDASGVLHLIGRRDGMVKTRGYRVELGEIEAAVAAQPGVAEVAVVAEPDPELTNRLHALVVPDRNQLADEDLVGQIVTGCRQRLPHYMVPGAVHLVPELPHTSTGKIARAELLDLVGATAGGRR
ncbi:amino acid adenylation domain-containing protein [Micromonospora sp. WMMD1082]|uniref:amino acid adenylation domain-containing protein n=1 Tax=Micromonospora sp. WMMD1082 TaxID=3016104 RepID=UPI0024159805|nr:amino acid adenylation domain-containing protein [Micromonospora sp. WMMD1082]MDG4795683.1 amino acid adenylation domain-containing protein [Micromonospora sp. WMMD1082]